MTIAARVSATEVDAIIRERFQDRYLEARLVNAPGVTYTPGTTDDATFLTSEVAAGSAGYQPQVIGYINSDFASYADGGVGLQQKATVFTQNGGATTLDFTHVALVWSSGNVSVIGATSGAPTAMTDGTYTAIPTVSAGSGVGMTIDLTVANGGAASTDYTLAISNPGKGYAASELISIPNGTLAGLDPGAGTGDLTFAVTTVVSDVDAGDIVAVAKTNNAVALSGGNQAVFYWNLKQFGFYSS